MNVIVPHLFERLSFHCERESFHWDCG